MFMMLQAWALSVKGSIQLITVELMTLASLLSPIIVAIFLWYMYRKVGWIMPDDSGLAESPAAIQAGVHRPLRRRK